MAVIRPWLAEAFLGNFQMTPCITHRGHTDPECACHGLGYDGLSARGVYTAVLRGLLGSRTDFEGSGYL